MTLRNNRVDTGVDLAFKLILLNQRMTLKNLAKILRLDPKSIEVWCGTLEKKKMIRMNYKVFGETEVLSNNGHSGEVRGMKRVKVMDWAVSCPKKSKNVMFLKNCQGCKHLKNIEGELIHSNPSYEFRPENVVCSWKNLKNARQVL